MRPGEGNPAPDRLIGRPPVRPSRPGMVSGSLGWILLLVLLRPWIAPAQSSERTRRMVVTTNWVVVTNLVLVTNYVDVADPPPSPAAPTPPPVPFATPTLTAPAWPDASATDPRFDWVQLKSGEWLKGRIRALQDDSLEFESEELEEQQFDWEDVRELRSARNLLIEFKDRRMVRGPVTISPTDIRVGGDSPIAMPRTNLFGLTPGGDRERDHWTAKLSAGLNVRTGNADQADYNARVDLRRRTPNTRFELEYLGAFSRIDGTDTQDNHRLETQFDYWTSPRFFILAPFFEYFRDPFQNLSHRVTAGAGVGYDLFDRPRFEWNVTVGPAFQEAWFASVLPGEAGSKSAAALVFGTKLDFELTRRIDLGAGYRGQYTRQEIGETTHHAEVRFEFELSSRLDLDLSLMWDRISQPRTASDGTTPQPDDFRFITTVGIEF